MFLEPYAHVCVRLGWAKGEADWVQQNRSRSPVKRLIRPGQAARIKS